MKKVRKKKCVTCGQYFTPRYKTTERACSLKCAIEHGKETQAKQKAALNELRNEKVNDERLAELANQARVKVHNYIRYRDRGKPCISCGKPWNSEFQAGHAWSAKNHNMIRYDYDAIHGQCKGCNLGEEGNYDEYRERLPKRIGRERFNSIKQRADIARRVPFKFSRHELKQIIRKALDDIRDLKAQEKL